MKNQDDTIRGKYLLQKESFTLQVDFSAPADGITAIFGRSGSGKTTLLRCVAGLEKKVRGLFEIHGEYWDTDISHLKPEDRSCAYVSQEDSLFEHLNVDANLLYGLKRYKRPDKCIHFDEVVEMLELQALLRKMPRALSGGQKQRVAIGRALLSQPKLILFDEPMANLDNESKQSILPYLEQINQRYEIPIFYVSHSPDEILRIASHIILIENGTVLAEGEINAILTDPKLPLIHLDQACSVVNAVLIKHLEQYELSELRMGSQTLLSPKVSYQPGEQCQVRIAAKDVSISLRWDNESSISNILPAKVIDIEPSVSLSRCVVRLEIEEQIILAQLTRYSIEKLKLSAGNNVYAQIKSVALLRS